MKSIAKFIFVVLSVAVITGCATAPQPIALSKMPGEGSKIGIALVEPVEADAIYTGNIGLLDLAIIAATNSTLNKHLDTLAFDDYYQLPNRVEAVLDGHGLDAEVLSERVSLDVGKKFKGHKQGLSRNDYSVINNHDEFDYLLVLSLRQIGTTRPYYGPVPTAQPVTTASLWGEMVDLKSKDVVWYQLINTTKTIAEPWDESDEQYPNLTNSVYVALNEAIESVIVDISNPRMNPVDLSQLEK